MTTYDELEKEFNKKVEKLQAECKHEDVSEWIALQWAPAHLTRFQVKICRICRKEIDRRTRCDGCGKMFSVNDLLQPTYEEYEGRDVMDLLTNAVPIDTYWCKDCYPNREEIWKKDYRD